MDRSSWVHSLGDSGFEHRFINGTVMKGARRRQNRKGAKTGDRTAIRTVATMDAPGYPAPFETAAGQAHGLTGVKPLLEGLESGTLAGDRASGSD